MVARPLAIQPTIGCDLAASPRAQSETADDCCNHRQKGIGIRRTMKHTSHPAATLFSPHSPIRYPNVTSSGSRILSPSAANFPSLTYGAIFVASDFDRQKPAPPVANQNFT